MPATVDRMKAELDIGIWLWTRLNGMRRKTSAASVSISIFQQKRNGERRFPAFARAALPGQLDRWPAAAWPGQAPQSAICAGEKSASVQAWNAPGASINAPIRSCFPASGRRFRDLQSLLVKSL
jgi:hypothetical protein